MNLYDVLNAVNGIPNEIRPFDKEKDADLYESEEQLQEFLDYLKDSGATGKILVTDKDIERIFYAEEDTGVYFKIHAFNTELLKMALPFSLKEVLPKVREQQKEAIAENNWVAYFMVNIPTAMLMYAFEKIYKEIPVDKVTEVFFMLYTHIDYDASRVNPEIFDYVCNHAKRKQSDKMVTIYRGEGDKSCSYKDAFSWTTNLNTAAFFAIRQGVGRAIYKGQVKESDIIFSTNERNEHEVIVKPESVQNVTRLDIYPCDNKDNILDLISSVFWDCKDYKDTIKELYPSSEESVHDKGHICRVLALANLLMDEGVADYNCADEDIARTLVSIAAVYHDCGRSHDAEDASHGKESAELFIKSEDARILDKEEEAIVYTAIQYHSIDDEKGIKAINENDAISDKDTAVLVYNVLKDADALDRYRLNGHSFDEYVFDYKYLRYDESKRLLFIGDCLRKSDFSDAVLK